MIRLVERSTLNEEKYNKCIVASEWSFTYAHTWYLDLISDWSCLVLNDYEVVMPLPWKSKWGIKYITQPYFCQQLGIFSPKTIDNHIKKSFLSAIPRAFIKVAFGVNFRVDSYKFLEKTNYILSLDSDYQSIKKNYRKDRKKAIRKAERFHLIYKDFDNRLELMRLYKKAFGDIYNSSEMYLVIERIINYCLTNQRGFIRNIIYDNHLVASGFFLINEGRIHYMFAAPSEEGKKKGAMTFLIDSVIKQYSESDMVFDFEGSSLPNVASFYKSFGSERTSYFHLNMGVFNRLLS